MSEDKGSLAGAYSPKESKADAVEATKKVYKAAADTVETTKKGIGEGTSTENMYERSNQKLKAYEQRISQHQTLRSLLQHEVSVNCVWHT